MFRLRVRIYVVQFGEDDPRKCTAEKMVRKGFAMKVPPREVPKKAIVLNPFASETLSPSDRELVEKYGVAVVDASWNRLCGRHFARVRGVHRRLPMLFAVNPVNYGIVNKLSSIEAVAAALYITGFREEACAVLSLFKWGRNFIEFNRELLEHYSSGDIGFEEEVKKAILRGSFEEDTE